MVRLQQRLPTTARKEGFYPVDHPEDEGREQTAQTQVQNRFAVQYAGNRNRQTSSTRMVSAT